MHIPCSYSVARNSNIFPVSGGKGETGDLSNDVVPGGQEFDIVANQIPTLIPSTPHGM